MLRDKILAEIKRRIEKCTATRVQTNSQFVKEACRDEAAVLDDFKFWLESQPIPDVGELVKEARAWVEDISGVKGTLIERLTDALETATAQIAKYRETLEWYADSTHYKIDQIWLDGDAYDPPDIGVDEGKRARSALGDK